jgi:2-keto-4-pentenoate hydratase/2-oxohepta-3-ene-1,7-dioic acid hydratase in catechol pathway
MKLATFTVDGGPPQLGVVKGNQVAPLGDIAADMIQLIAEWSTLEPVARGVEHAFGNPYSLDQVKLLAPIPRPGKMMAIGLNYADHIAESGQETPKEQLWFAKMGTSVNAPFDPIQIPKASKMVDWEVELVAVIGKGGKNLSLEEAPAAVFGYCCGNDVTARDWQFRTPQWTLGKSFDTHAPFGPWITTADEAPDPKAGMGLRCLVNGKLMQDSNSRHLVFDVPAQVSQLSQAMTLEPGDIIFTGTPGGVGISMKPPQFLKAGDVVRVEIDGLGEIEAVCEAE